LGGNGGDQLTTVLPSSGGLIPDTMPATIKGKWEMRVEIIICPGEFMINCTDTN
jgi:hypothetical protein